jgi:hypothetical protein
VKPKLQQLLQEADSDQLNEILYLLVNKYRHLEDEIELILTPKSIQNPVAYYQRIVKKAIDTNSYRNFPLKGVKGLSEMVIKMELFVANKTYDEAWKIGIAILKILMRCLDAGNIQHTEELFKIKNRVVTILSEISGFLNLNKLAKQKKKWTEYLVGNIGWQYTHYFIDKESGKSGLVVLRDIINNNENSIELVEIMECIKIQIEHPKVKKSILCVYLHCCLKLGDYDSIKILRNQENLNLFIDNFCREYDNYLTN